ncbi:hypothetical protein A71_97 [Escherichia phage A7_1]|nr:hypothetical protein A71_97 [Escherichia phage A7_1]
MTKQVVELKVTYEIDYTNEDMAEMLKAKMEKSGLSIEEIFEAVEKELVEGTLESMELECKTLPGFSVGVVKL